MKKQAFFLLLLFSFLSQLADGQQPGKSFKVFNAMLYKNTPDILRGVNKIKVVYELEMLSLDPTDRFNSKKRFINSNKIQSVANKTNAESNPILCLDIESWNLRKEQGGDSSIKKYLDVLNKFKQVNSACKIGYFGVVPFDQDVESFYKGQYSKTRWTNRNIYLQTIYNHVDIIFPVFYTMTTDRNLWENFVKIQMSMIKNRKRNLPIYAFVWPQYFNTGDQNKDYKFIDAATWRYELETIYKYCDGVVIWGSPTDANNNPQYWNDQAPWWLETQKFISEHHISN